MADEKKNATEAPASSGIGTGGKIAIVAILAAAVVGVVWIKQRGGDKPAVQPTNGGQTSQPVAATPKLVDLGAGKCIPCKMMAPILEELKGEYKGRLDVVFVDVWENPKAGEPYGIKLIPTQIFFDAKGKELFRHEGFFSKEDILGKWKELGVTFDEQKASSGSDEKL